MWLEQMYVKIPNNQAIFLAQLLLWFAELNFTMCILILFSVDGWPGWYSVNNISWVDNFSFFYISASPNIHGKLLYINHHRPKGQLIEMMALIPWQYNCTLSNQLYAFEFPASAFFLVNRQRGTFWEVSETIFNCRSRRIRYFSRNLGV